MKPISVLFVCLGNICRSPAAEAILVAKASQHPHLAPLLHVESCGLGSWHVGELPDSRMRATARERGVDMTSRAQTFIPLFFEQFDYILAADHSVLAALEEYCLQPEHRAKIQLMTHYSKKHTGQEVPDPYFGGDEGFASVWEMLEESCQQLLLHIEGNIRKEK